MAVANNNDARDLRRGRVAALHCIGMAKRRLWLWQHVRGFRNAEYKDDWMRFLVKQNLERLGLHQTADTCTCLSFGRQCWNCTTCMDGRIVVSQVL